MYILYYARHHVGYTEEYDTLEEALLRAIGAGMVEE